MITTTISPFLKNFGAYSATPCCQYAILREKVFFFTTLTNIALNLSTAGEKKTIYTLKLPIRCKSRKPDWLRQPIN